jgi:hypothetical protein
VIERETFVVTIEDVIQLLCERLRVVQELDGRKISDRFISFPLLFLPLGSVTSIDQRRFLHTIFIILRVFRVFFSLLLVFLFISRRCRIVLGSGS